jgi:alpha-beta hydrolase superfamily lysophospholipase
MMAGDMDATAPMEHAARALAAAGVRTTYLEMPHARHGQMGDSERLMGQALDWVFADDAP